VNAPNKEVQVICKGFLIIAHAGEREERPDYVASLMRYGAGARLRPEDEPSHAGPVIFGDESGLGVAKILAQPVRC
jgi:hypothetical protein